MWYPPLTLHCPSDFPPLKRHGQQYCVAVIVVCSSLPSRPHLKARWSGMRWHIWAEWRHKRRYLINKGPEKQRMMVRILAKRGSQMRCTGVVGLQMEVWGPFPAPLHCSYVEWGGGRSWSRWPGACRCVFRPARLLHPGIDPTTDPSREQHPVSE